MKLMHGCALFDQLLKNEIYAGHPNPQYQSDHRTLLLRRDCTKHKCIRLKIEATRELTRLLGSALVLTPLLLVNG
jgi:hypothetical protein